MAQEIAIEGGSKPSALNRVLTIFFAAWFFIHAVFVLLGLFSLPLYYERVTTLTIEPFLLGELPLVSNELTEENADARGLTLSQYAVGQILFGGALAILFSVVGGLIAWRARWNWYAWYTAFFMLFIAAYALFQPQIVARLIPPSVYEIGSIFWPLILLYFFLFPDGKPVPRFALWVILPLTLIHLMFQAAGTYLSFQPSPALGEMTTNLLPVLNFVIPLEFTLVFLCQVYRYLRVSTWLEKQQTKWFLFGLGVIIATIPLELILELFAANTPVGSILGENSPYTEELDILFFAFVPLTVGIAILRYRLFDIDVIIRRTVTYAVVTGLLVVIFFGSVILLQQLFATFTESGSNDFITVVSTLVIAALFVPLRNRVQGWIDRRFNRKKYDAQQVLQKFGETVRDETDLDRLTNELVNVVQDTMQPKSVSLWLKQGEGRSE